MCRSRKSLQNEPLVPEIHLATAWNGLSDIGNSDDAILTTSRRAKLAPTQARGNLTPRNHEALRDGQGAPGQGEDQVVPP